MISGAVIAFLIGLPVYLDTLNLFAGIWAGMLSGTVAGITKEWTDTIYDNKWSWKDLGYTVIGSAIVAIFMILLHIGKG